MYIGTLLYAVHTYNQAERYKLGLLDHDFIQVINHILCRRNSQTHNIFFIYENER